MDNSDNNIMVEPEEKKRRIVKFGSCYSCKKKYTQSKRNQLCGECFAVEVGNKEDYINEKYPRCLICNKSYSSKLHYNPQYEFDDKKYFEKRSVCCDCISDFHRNITDAKFSTICEKAFLSVKSSYAIPIHYLNDSDSDSSDQDTVSQNFVPCKSCDDVNLDDIDRNKPCELCNKVTTYDDDGVDYDWSFDYHECFVYGVYDHLCEVCCDYCRESEKQIVVMLQEYHHKYHHREINKCDT